MWLLEYPLRFAISRTVSKRSVLPFLLGRGPSQTFIFFCAMFHLRGNERMEMNKIGVPNSATHVNGVKSFDSFFNGNFSQVD
jgi:hypothetical protein